MILFPAIDLKDGQCVRLIKGDMTQATNYNDNPADQAKSFEALGFKWLHLVDLNGAFSGKSENRYAIESILNSISIPVQLGGGIRDLKSVQFWLERGVSRVILGTIAAKDPDFVKEACKEFEGRVAVGIDARDGYVAVEGWAETTSIKAIDLASKFSDIGVAALIYTDINRDGILTGVNWDETISLASQIDIPVIASGGLSSIEDIKTLITPRAQVLEGAISGRALYDGKFDPIEALKILGEAA